LPETFGAYVVHEELGTGGMATVHRAELPGIEGFSKEVALKRMLPHLTMHKEVVNSFVREGRLASFLHHANIAQTLELGKVDSTYFIAMELVTGRTLGDIQRRCGELGAPLSLALTLNILNQLCDALDHAHNMCDEDGLPLDPWIRAWEDLVEFEIVEVRTSAEFWAARAPGQGEAAR